MNGNNQQAYDRGTNIFSPDGRLYQVEYAREAVSRGSASVGISTQDGVVLAAECQTRSELLKTDSIEKLHEVDHHIGIASAGHVADARQLVDKARQQAQINRLRYGDAIGVEALGKHITDHIQQFTQRGAARPYGVAMLFGGIEDGDPRLFEADPSGTPYEWKAAAIGGNRDTLQPFLEENYIEDCDLDGGIDLALEALATVNDGSLATEEIGVSTIDRETAQYDTLDESEREQYLSENDLLTGDHE